MPAPAKQRKRNTSAFAVVGFALLLIVPQVAVACFVIAIVALVGRAVLRFVRSIRIVP